MTQTTFELDKNAFSFTRSFEGERLQAYQDSAGVWTISVGITRYLNGEPVKASDTVTPDQSNGLFTITLRRVATLLTYQLPGVMLTQNQINAITDFTFNLGAGAFSESTLRKLILANPKDPAIRDAFMMWDKAKVNGELVVVHQLAERRKAEADLYFS